ncbi:hypothetical protein [Noviherbaspirillum sp. UKPF54]|uniref:hypothetical protein n=1 Tax=Noviherbaspirillum sp. UKPF54 TaxID=2601898 RepID=UPI001AEF429B|nr:hypothetical protein [Noviherbaspirillum sp. UKPF54]
MSERAEIDVGLLNSKCFCISLDNDALRNALESELGLAGLSRMIEQRCPHLFAPQPVFLSRSQQECMGTAIAAIESVIALPAYREAVLATAPAIARHDPGGAKGVFFGYDFHVDGDRVGLIEINTNAGGAMLNAALARAHRACCAEVESILSPLGAEPTLEANILSMFRAEWAASGRNSPLRTIAIVDTFPEDQYLYPEFLLFQQLFRRAGLAAVIADPSELVLRDGVLWHGNTAIDLVYNRLTDFMLEQPSSAALRQAYLDHAAVLTPHPQAHALYADKRNLALLSDAGQLDALGVPPATQAILLATIPRTELVSMVNAEQLWAQRRSLFFKPVAGFGGRAAYRGDKLTKRVWQEILAGEYVAQTIVTPGERASGPEDKEAMLKFDVRNYVYDGAVQSLAARLYQGQTTNFRTPGGGFAPIYRWKERGPQLPAPASPELTAGP